MTQATLPKWEAAGPGFGQREAVREIVKRYLENPLFSNDGPDNAGETVFRRPVRPQDADVFDFSTMLDKHDFCAPSALMAQRMLLNIYETDLVFLPNGSFQRSQADFDWFYSDATKLHGELLRPTLERHLFGFLDQEIDVSGDWTVPAMRAYFNARLHEADAGESALCAAIQNARDPETAARFFLIQLAGDYLTEASAMARNVLGRFGPIQSGLFTVLIDEYGYGVHDTKHSTMFEKTLRSVGLCADVHAYWQLYLTSSLSLINYFHFISRNHRHFFRYLGALYYTESTLVEATRQQSAMLSAVFGEKVDTRYFDEHTHIDQHHGRMAIEHLIVPAVEKWGTGIIPQIIRGFEEFGLLQELADQDLIDQIAWSDRGEENRVPAEAVRQRDATGPQGDAPVTFVEPQGELSVSHVHDVDELLVVREGTLEVTMGYNTSLHLGAGEGIKIDRHRLHGSLVHSDSCTYDVRPYHGASQC